MRTSPYRPATMTTTRTPRMTNRGGGTIVLRLRFVGPSFACRFPRNPPADRRLSGIACQVGRIRVSRSGSRRQHDGRNTGRAAPSMAEQVLCQGKTEEDFYGGV